VDERGGGGSRCEFGAFPLWLGAEAAFLGRLDNGGSERGWFWRSLPLEHAADWDDWDDCSSLRFWAERGVAEDEEEELDVIFSRNFFKSIAV
jgi:hypothetical protein